MAKERESDAAAPGATLATCGLSFYLVAFVAVHFNLHYSSFRCLFSVAILGAVHLLGIARASERS